jgi:hypothetical protein
MYGRVHNYLDPEYKPNEKELLHERTVVTALRAAYAQGLDNFK